MRKEKELDESFAREEYTLEKQIKIEEARVKQVELASGQGRSAVSMSERRGKAPKLPAFNEQRDNIDAYLRRFEHYANTQGWPKEHWAVDLSALLSGKGLEVYYSLNEEQASNYDTLKKAILNRYELNEVGFRKRFKQSKPEVGESGVQYGNWILNYFKCWVDLAIAEDSKEGIIDLIIRDQFVNSIPQDIAMFVREREPATMQAMTELADQCLNAHGNWVGNSYVRKEPHPKSTFVKKASFESGN